MADLRVVPGGRGPRKKPPDETVVVRLERAVLSGLLRAKTEESGALMRQVKEILRPTDFFDPRLATVYNAMESLDPVELHTLADELDRRAISLDSSLNFEFLTGLYDEMPTAALVTNHAARVRRNALERAAAKLGEQIAKDPTDASLKAHLEIAWDKIQALDAGGVGLTELGFSGPKLQRLRDRPRPDSPLPGLLSRWPSVHLLTGKPKTAKTRFALWLALAWAKGHRPWEGAPELPRGYVTILSNETPAIEIEEMLRQLEAQTDTPNIERWSERINIIAYDQELSARARSLLTLDARGRAMLRSGLARDREQERPCSLLVLDSLSRLKPHDFDENSAGDMTAFLQPLQDLSREFACHQILIHHQGHTSDPSRSSAVSAGRGSSAIAAVCSVAWTLDRVPNEPRQRLLAVAGNDVPGKSFVFSVNENERLDEDLVLGFTLTDELGSMMARLDDLVPSGSDISTSTLAWRILDRDPAKGEQPPGGALRAARKLREHLLGIGLVEVVPGARGAKMIRRP